VLDKTVLSEAIGKDPAGVNSLLNNLADKVAGANGIVASYTKFGGHIEQAVKTNQTEVDNTKNRLARVDAVLARQEEAMRKMFAKLESRISELNSGASSLAALLGGL